MRSTPLDFGRHCSGDCSHALHRHLCAVRKTLAGFARILLLTVCIYARRRCRVGEIKVRTKWNATTDWHQCSVRHFARTNDNMMWKLSIFNENCTCGTQPHTYTHTGTSIRHLQASHVKCGVWSNVRCCFSCYKFPLNSPITLTPQSPREGHATSIFFVWPLPKLRPIVRIFYFSPFSGTFICGLWLIHFALEQPLQHERSFHWLWSIVEPTLVTDRPTEHWSITFRELRSCVSVF